MTKIKGKGGFDRVALKRIAQRVFVALLVAGAVVFVRSSSTMQRLDFFVYDRLVHLRAVLDDRPTYVALIGLTEADIQGLGHDRLSDSQLLDLLKQVSAGRPTVIGVDIFRDSNAFKGIVNASNRDALDLAEYFGQQPNIVGVFGVEPKIDAPRGLATTGRLGFADVYLDFDGVLRRAPLYLNTDAGTYRSFGLRTALQYLRSFGIEEQKHATEKGTLVLGKSTLRLLSSQGMYKGRSIAGSQFLLKFRTKELPVMSFSDALSGKNSESFENKVVLIGVVAESVKDDFSTPTATFIRGLQVQATAIDQLIYGALNGASPVQLLSGPMETFLVFGVVASTAVMASWFGGLPVAIVGSILIGVCTVGLFWLGWIFPVAPVATAFLLSASVASPRRTLQPQWWDPNRPEQIAEFVVDSGELVDEINLRAFTHLQYATRSVFDGFAEASRAAKEDPVIVDAIAEAYYRSLHELELRYENEYAFNMRTGSQAIRTPLQIRKTGVATCVDLSLLYLSGLASVKTLNPVYVQINTGVSHHALAAVWRDGRPPDQGPLLDKGDFMRSVSVDEIRVVDITGVTKSIHETMDFNQACTHARRLLNSCSCEFVCDIQAAKQASAARTIKRD